MAHCMWSMQREQRNDVIDGGRKPGRASILVRVEVTQQRSASLKVHINGMVPSEYDDVVDACHGCGEVVRLVGPLQIILWHVAMIVHASLWVDGVDENDFRLHQSRNCGVPPVGE